MPPPTGDIAASPLYVYSVVFYGVDGAPRPPKESVLGATSMIIWILTWLLVRSEVNVHYPTERH